LRVRAVLADTLQHSLLCWATFCANDLSASCPDGQTFR
jgi:hypothetical protein